MEKDTLRAQLEDIGKQIAQAYKDKIERKDAMVHKVPSPLHEFRWTVGNAGDVWLLTFNLPKEWAYVEAGRRPGKFPPPDAIRQWIQVKPLVPRAGKNGKVPTIRQLAFLISRKIAEKGISARPILSTTLQDNYSLIDQFTSKVAKAYGREIDAELINIPEEIAKINITL